MVVAVVGVLVLAGSYVTWTAKRLDRLHTRLDAAALSLDTQLVRRAEAADALAVAAGARGQIPPEATGRVRAAVETVRRAKAVDRVPAENALGRTFGAVFGGPGTETPVRTEPALAAAVAELDEAMTTVGLARQFHATAVEDTLGLRRRRLVRLLRLAGHAPLPHELAIDDTPAPIGISPVPELR